MSYDPGKSAGGVATSVYSPQSCCSTPWLPLYGPTPSPPLSFSETVHLGRESTQHLEGQEHAAVEHLLGLIVWLLEVGVTAGVNVL
jgi:hypothetical protein